MPRQPARKPKAGELAASSTRVTRQAHRASKAKSKVEFAEPLPQRRKPCYSPSTSSASAKYRSPESVKYRSRASSETPASSPRRFPFNVPPSQMTKKAFLLANPFLKILKSTSTTLEEDHPFADTRHMNRQALLAAIDGITVSAPMATLVTENASSELGSRGFHLSLASDFWRITRPAPKPSVTSTQDASILLDISDSDIDCDDSDSTGGDGNYDLDVDIQMTASSSSTSSSPFSLDIKQEGNPGGEERELKFDLQFRVIDLTVDGPDNTVPTLLVDCKGDNVSSSKMWQLATYGIDSALKNMEKGRFKPVYLEIWGFTLWSYAIIYPHALVEVKQGKVVSVSTTMSGYIVAAMDKLLQKATIKLQKSLQDPFIGFENEWYFAGLVYINMKKFLLPQFACKGGAQHPDCLKFFEGNIRILVGDRVLDWKKKDVVKAIAVREEQLRSMKSRFMK